MNLIRSISVAGLVLFVAGCGVRVTQPLSDPSTSEADESLYGHWLETVKQDGKVGEFHVFIGKHWTQGNPKAIMELGSIGWCPDDKQVKSYPTAYFTVTRIGRDTYMNLIGGPSSPDFSLSDEGSYAKWIANEKKTCEVFRYVCDGKTFQAWTVADVDAKLKSLREAGDLKMVGGVVTSDSLVGYLGKNGGEKLFDKKGFDFRKIP